MTDMSKLIRGELRDRRLARGADGRFVSSEETSTETPENAIRRGVDGGAGRRQRDPEVGFNETLRAR